MSALKRFVFLPLLVVVGFAPVACSTWEPPSPTAPSQFGSAPSSGAVVTGVVNGGQTLSAKGLAPQSASDMTVTVVGTNISASVSVSGRFVLQGVPAGNIRLQFSAPGVNAVITVTSVEDHQQIDIKVTVSGNRGSLDSCMRIDGHDDVDIEGEITQVSGTCPSLTIIVHGTAVRLSIETQGACANVHVGIRIKIKGHRESSTIVVIKIEVVGNQSSPPRDDSGHHDDDDD